MTIMMTAVLNSLLVCFKIAVQEITKHFSLNETTFSLMCHLVDSDFNPPALHQIQKCVCENHSGSSFMLTSESEVYLHLYAWVL